MNEKTWQIAIFGTFDVQNYGDLLFPPIAEAELTQRLGRVELHRFSYHAKSAPEWPYAVTSVTDLADIAPQLDGILIGGGFIVRFDKDVAQGYGPPAWTIHHPTGYWLTPSLIALQHGIPLIWNAPGMHCNDIPRWSEPLMRLALRQSRYISVRDEPSRDALLRVDHDASITVLPDTAFGISRLIDERNPSAEFQQLRSDLGLTKPYVVIQAARCGLHYFLQLVKRHAALFEDYQFLVLPIGPVLGDHERNVDADLPGAVRLAHWPHPPVVAELISQAQAVFGHSYHLAITAQAFGVPVFSTADLSAGKYTALAGFDTIYALPTEAELDPYWILARFGKGCPSEAAARTLDVLSGHWNRVAKLIRAGRVPTQSAVDRFWQSLPHLLQAADDQRDALEKENAQSRWQIDQLCRLLAADIRPNVDRAANQHHIDQLLAEKRC